MGGEGSGRPPGIKGIVERFQRQTPIATQGSEALFLPNYSGVTNDNKVNKKFVPYSNAISNVDLNGKNLTTTGNLAIGTTTISKTLTVSGEIGITGNTPASGLDAVDMFITGGAGGAGANGGKGADLSISSGIGGGLGGGSAGGDGGDITITAGIGQTGVSNGGDGGNISITCGNGRYPGGDGGDLSLIAGAATLSAAGLEGDGGTVTITTGAGGNYAGFNPGTGGDMTLTTGKGGDGVSPASPGKDGGTITITAGAGGSSGGTQGSFIVNSYSNEFTGAFLVDCSTGTYGDIIFKFGGTDIMYYDNSSNNWEYQSNINLNDHSLIFGTSTIYEDTGLNALCIQPISDLIVYGGLDVSSGYKTNGTPGISITITTAKLTSGGANGSMTFTDGLLTAQTQAT